MVGVETGRPHGSGAQPSLRPKARNLGRFRAYAYAYMYHMFWTQNMLYGLLLSGFGDEPPSSSRSEEDPADDEDDSVAEQLEKARCWFHAAQQEQDNGGVFATDKTGSGVRRYRNRTKAYLCVRKSPSPFSPICGTITPKQAVRGTQVTFPDKSGAPGAAAESIKDKPHPH